jgi:glucokinase
MSERLLADIGGSKSRFALINSAGRPDRVLVIENDAVADLPAAIECYLEKTAARPTAATFAVAGLIEGDEVALTNRAWRFNRDELARRFGFAPLGLLNDFEAIAWSLPHLAASDVRLLEVSPRTSRGKRGRRNGVKVVLGPGTGLGVAALVPADGRWHVLASEGGHAAFGPQAADEVEVFGRLRDQCGGSVSAETVLSGPGLIRLARALGMNVHSLPPGQVSETIVTRALGGDPSALAVTRLFVRLLGRFAGSLALTFKALGGVYVAGGVASGLGRLLDEADFRAAFEAHPPYQALLATIPSLLITCDQPGLVGCAAVAQKARALEGAVPAS